VRHAEGLNAQITLLLPLQSLRDSGFVKEQMFNL